MATNQTNPIPQAAAVPYRWRDAEPEFCLITSSSGKRWGFPKGLIDPGETVHETALKEAQEEAGLHGRIEGEPLGSYTYRKWGSELLVTVFLMRVTRVNDEWLEADLRERCWCRAESARDKMDNQALRELLDAAMARLGA